MQEDKKSAERHPKSTSKQLDSSTANQYRFSEQRTIVFSGANLSSFNEAEARDLLYKLGCTHYNGQPLGPQPK